MNASESPRGSAEHPIRNHSGQETMLFCDNFPGLPGDCCFIDNFRPDKPCIIDASRGCRVEIARKLASSSIPRVASVPEIHREDNDTSAPWKTLPIKEACVHCRTMALHILQGQNTVSAEGMAVYAEAMLNEGQSDHPDIVDRVRRAIEDDPEVAAEALELERMLRGVDERVAAGSSDAY